MDSSVFTAQQLDLLNQALDSRLVSNRKGAANSTLRYLEGHDAIDQANRIFGYGNWAYRPLSCEQKVIYDPTTGEAVGVSYTALVELTVRGCVAPIVEKGVQPVASWNVADIVMGKRKRDEDKSRPIEQWERANAMRIIGESHEVAEKGAVTDGLKRALRSFGAQFGNSLYGEAHGAEQPAQQPKPQQLPAAAMAKKAKDLRDSAVKRGLLGHDEASWNEFKEAMFGAVVPDGALTQEQYNALLNELKAPSRAA